MSEEQKELSQKEIDERDFQGLLICIGIGIGLAIGYFIFKITDWYTIFDFENKKYIPYTFNNELLLINIKNGKTYRLEYNEVDNKYFYKYQFLARPKTNKYKYFEFQEKNSGVTSSGVKYKILNEDPLGLFKTN